MAGDQEQKRDMQQAKLEFIRAETGGKGANEEAGTEAKTQ